MFAAREGAEARACDLREYLGLPQPSVPHYLKVLGDEGILYREKRSTLGLLPLLPGTLESVTALFTFFT